MKLWQRFTGRIGSLPAARVTWGLVILFSVWVLLDVFVLKFTGGLTQSSYDAMVRSRIFVAAPDPRIVIIDIDEASLARMGKEFGRWPWPRDTLATVLDHVERQQPQAIVWDILFSDVDRLSPGGDAAFNQAASQSQHSYFSVVRLPKANDGASHITALDLPGLWVSASDRPAQAAVPAPPVTLALIPPALPAVAAGRLGYNNGYVESDGVLRRYRYLEPLSDGTAIQSIALSVAAAINPHAQQDILRRSAGALKPVDELIAWRRKAGAYEHLSFADVFAQAEGDKPLVPVPGFAGKVVIIGSTAPSLHDIHPTPLSSMQAGVDSLATVIDNALNQRSMRELPRWLQAVLAIALCVGLALWVKFRSAASLAPALLVLPGMLVGISYLSLNGLPVFVDLHLAAGLALLFLAVLRYWSTLRRNHWCSPLADSAQPIAIWPWERADAWLEASLDRLIDALEQHAPSCRVVVCDAPPSGLRWPELARFAAVVGPHAALLAARAQLEPVLLRLAQRCTEPLLIDAALDREQMAKEVFSAWARLQNTGPGSA
jgi:CHASE2 domain-containing sensor protein